MNSQHGTEPIEGRRDNINDIEDGCPFLVVTGDREEAEWFLDYAASTIATQNSTTELLWSIDEMIEAAWKLIFRHDPHGHCQL
jgi:hypothetical protein